MNVDLKLTAIYDKLLSKIQSVEAIRGQQGDKGDAGVAGPTGEQGAKGDKGDNGKDGKDGKDGTDGVDGTDGAAGVGVEDATVDFDGHLVLTLTNGEEVDAGSVKELSEDTEKPTNVYNISMGSLASRADLKNARAKIVTTDHTTGGSEILKVNNGCVINLREYPQDRETVLVNVNTEEQVDIVGLINIVNPDYYDIAEYITGEFGYASLVVDHKNTTFHLIYIQEFNEWLAI
jgi:hypothetical protein